MPRRRRLFVSGGIYHVYCKTHRGEHRFDDPAEADSFVHTVSRVANSHGLDILAWCLMSNHYHLVVQTSDVKLWRTMAGIHGRVTQAFNRRHNVRGPSWQGRYRARLVQDNDDLRNLLAYVHLNPVIAGIADDPAEFRMSGHREIIGCRSPWLVNVGAALRSFEERSSPLARMAYLEFIRHVAETKWARAEVRELPWWKPVRDDHQLVAESDAPPLARTFDDKHPDLPLPQDEPLESVLERAAPLLGVSVSEICGRGKRQAAVEARRRFALIASRYFDYPLKTIAQTLDKSPHQVSRWLSRETEAHSSNCHEATRVDDVAANLLRTTQTRARAP